MPIWLRRLFILLVVVSAAGWWVATNTHRQAPSTGLVASFTFGFQGETSPTNCTVNAVRFTDTSSGSPTSWRWTFDDGQSSTEQNPVWKSNGRGSLKAKLTVRAGGASSSATQDFQFPVC
jgi:PKD repeat protein